MRKIALTALLVLSCTLCGCMQSDQIENQAYVLILGLDRTETDIEVSVQILKAAGTSSGADSGSDSHYLLADGTGATYSDAMRSLQSRVQRRLNMSQTILVVVSEDLARSGRFDEVLTDIYESYLYDASAWFAVCSGSAKEFVAAQKPVIGSRVSAATTAMLENYVDLGLVPDSTLAEVFYAMKSGFSDPVAIHASCTEQGRNEYSGAAVFRDRQMVETLTGDEVLCLNLLQGGLKNFVLNADGHAAFLAVSSAPQISVDVSRGVPDIEISIHLTMERLSGLPDTETVERQLLQSMSDLLTRCQTADIEPFGFASAAVTHFPTLDDWDEFDWDAKFREARWSIDLEIRMIDA